VSDSPLFEDESIYLHSGNWIFFFTKGIYRLYSTNNNTTGRTLFEKDITDTQGISASEFLVDLNTMCKRLSDSSLQKEDITILSVEILSESRKEQIKEKLGFKREDPVYLQYLSYYEEMDKTVGIILRDMDAVAFPDEFIRKMKITLTELLANAIGHGNNENHAKKVTMGHIVTRDSALIAIMDEGEGFDPATIPDPTLPENLIKDHGRGLYIVRNYVDEIKHNETGNRILICKYHHYA
jgi:serine/threonine-protein kinase RsbW